MNSSILVSGFVIVGVGAMAVFFAPFGSNDAAAPELAGAYKSTKAKVSSVSGPSEVSPVADPEPFVWEDTKKEVSSNDMLEDLNIGTQSTAVSKVKKAKRGLSKAVANNDETSLQKPTAQEKTSRSDTYTVGANVASTADADLDSFFGASKPTFGNSKSAAKSTETIKTTVAKKESVEEPVLDVPFESAPIESAPIESPVKSDLAQTAQLTKASPADDMFSFSQDGEEKTEEKTNDTSKDALDFDMPEIEPVADEQVATKSETGSDEISGSLQTVVTKPAVADPVAEIKIKNPLQTRLTVTFLVDGKKVALKPGQHYRIRKAELVNVKFSRGGSFGFAEKALSDGDYYFNVSRKAGWNLVQ